MAAHRIVKGFAVVKDHGAGFGSGGRKGVVAACGFEGGPKGFGGGVIVAVCAAAQALIQG